MKSSIDIRVRIPVADIVDAMSDEVAREVERQIAPFVPVPPAVERPARVLSPSASVDEAISAVVEAVTRLENSTHTRDEVPAVAALRKAALSLRSARKLQIQKEKYNV